jgi:hypothetical protein
VILLLAAAANIIFYTISIMLLCFKRLTYKIDFNSKKQGCTIYRIWFWVMEIMLIPLLLNISWPATCNFWTERDAITLIDCKEDGPVTWWIMKALQIAAFIMALLYNIYLLYILEKNKVNARYHEESIQKKEVEFVYKINNIWQNEKFYTFSSYKSGVLSMYHRIINNMFAISLVAVSAFGSTGNIKERQLLITIHTILCIIHCLIVITNRPYRTFSTNIMTIFASIGFTQMMIVMYCKVNEYKQSIFIDKYFFVLTLILNTFCWFLVFTWICVTIIVKSQWAITKESVELLVEG